MDTDSDYDGAYEHGHDDAMGGWDRNPYDRNLEVRAYRGYRDGNAQGFRELSRTDTVDAPDDTPCIEHCDDWGDRRGPLPRSHLNMQPRNPKLTLDYVYGKAVTKIAEEEKLSKQRVYQIIKRTLADIGYWFPESVGIPVEHREMIASRLHAKYMRDPETYYTDSPAAFWHEVERERDADRAKALNLST